MLCFELPYLMGLVMFNVCAINIKDNHFLAFNYLDTKNMTENNTKNTDSFQVATEP